MALSRLITLPLALGLVLAAGCQATPAPGRRIVAVQWDTLWQTTATLADSALFSPALLTFNDGRVFVLDRAIPRVVALDAGTGRLLWTAGRSGAGPTEFTGVSAMFPERDGGVGIVDIRNRRVTHLNGLGRLAGIVSTGAMGQQPNQVCPAGASGFLVADVWQPVLVEFDSTGTFHEPRPAIWPDLASARWEAQQVILRNEVDSGRCLVALSTGRGFALLSPGRQPVLGLYIEPFEVYGFGARAADTAMTYWATYDAEFAADTLTILFAGRTVNRYRLLDRYLAGSGAYLDSYLLPAKTSDIAVGGQAVFVIDTSGTRIVALRPRR